MKAEVRVDDAKVLAGLKAASKEINQGVKEGLRRGAERHGLPAARHLAPGHRIRQALRAGATTRSAFLEVDLRKAPEAGLLEFGGTVRTVLEPKHAKALKTPYGPRAVVRGPRRYRARRYMQQAVERTLPQVTREAQEAVAEAIGKHLEVE